MIIKESDLVSTCLRQKAFFTFMKERLRILRKKEAAKPWPWTTDAIFATYSFTNVKRSDDKTSKVFIQIFNENRKPKPSVSEVMLNSALMRLVNKIFSIQQIGWIKNIDAKSAQKIRFIHNNLIESGHSFFGSGYVIFPSNTKGESTLDAILRRIEFVSKLTLPTTKDAWSWEVLCESLCEIPGIQMFSAKEICLEFIQGCAITQPNFQYPGDWDTWTPVGPGALRGVSWILYGDPTHNVKSEALEEIQELYDDPEVQKIATMDGGVQLDLTDIQFQLCEFDKYLRAFSGRGRPKKKYRPNI